MRFWDASAIVPLVVAEEETANCRRLLAEDTEVVVWFLTSVEVYSALSRRLREGSLKLPDFRKAKERFFLLEKAWSEVVSVERVPGIAPFVFWRITPCEPPTHYSLPLPLSFPKRTPGVYLLFLWIPAWDWRQRRRGFPSWESNRKKIRG